MNNQLSKHLSVSQLYELWSSEPELIEVLDLRPEEDFAKGRIPGSRRMAGWPDVARHVRTDHGDKLYVVIEDANRTTVEVAETEFENVVRLKGRLSEWCARGLPLCGQNIKKREETAMTKGLIFHQLFEPQSSTYTYLLADEKTREAILIDPVLETVDRDQQLLNELGLRLIYVLDTHIHADHITGAGELRRRTGARVAVSGDAGAEGVDVPLEDGQQLRFGQFTITALATPGHTNACMSYHMDGKVFTGDALLIRGTGRTDFQMGSSEQLYQSVHDKLFALPEDTVVYPGHDYRGFTTSSIGQEKLYNPRLGAGKSQKDFIKTMSELKLAEPKRIHEAVPANMTMGTKLDRRVFHPQVVNGIPEVTCSDVLANLGKDILLVDVRRPEEFNNEYGHIPGAVLVTLGPQLLGWMDQQDRGKEIVFICRSGGRSGQATAMSIELGFKKTANMIGGMIKWNELGYQIERK